MRVKLYMLSLIPNAALAGWVMFQAARMLGQPLLVAPRNAGFVILMAFVAGGTFALLNLIVVLLLGLRLVQKNGQFVLVERSKLAN